MNATSIATGLALQKYWNSQTYAPAARVVNIYSQRLGKAILEWSAQDAAQANMIQQCVYPLAKKEGMTSAYGPAPAAAVPLCVPPVKTPKPEEAENVALAIIMSIAASESHCADLIARAAENPLAKHLHQVLDLAALAQVSRDREQDALEMDAMIRENRLWASPTFIEWRCLKCGFRINNKNSFQECPCCKANRSYATAGGW